MATRYMKKCLTSLIIREVKNKSIRRCHLVPVGIAISKKIREQVLGRGISACCCWKCKLVKPLWQKVWRFFTKLKPELCEYIFKVITIEITKTICALILTEALFTIANLSVYYGWMDKEVLWYINLNKEILSFTPWMDLEDTKWN